MALSDRAALSRALSQELGSFSRQQVSVQTVQRRLEKHGLSAWRPWVRLPLAQHQRSECLQWCDQRRTWTHKWTDILFFSDESRFFLQHQDIRIRVWRYRGERTFTVSIRH
ncbi:HTH_Tnp_Tc3_2 domain-containing protein [Trichonephila clavipes]|nr:HTH_Tnp_Tc3_2 domain-containing protein [Trichonephila clavipes]